MEISLNEFFRRLAKRCPEALLSITTQCNDSRGSLYLSEGSWEVISVDLSKKELLIKRYDSTSGKEVVWGFGVRSPCNILLDVSHGISKLKSPSGVHITLGKRHPRGMIV